MGLYNAVFRSGSLIAVLVGGVLVDLIGIKLSFLIISSTMLLCFPVISLIYESDSYPSLNTKQPTRSRLLPTGGYTLTFWSLLTGSRGGVTTQRSRLLAIHYTRFTNTFAISGLVTATIGLLLKERIGDSLNIDGFVLGVATLTGIVLATSWAGEVGLSTYFGGISDKFGRRSVLLICLPVVILGSAILIIKNVFVIVIVVPIVFAATTASKITLDASAGDLSSDLDKSEVMSRYATWTDLGAASGPIAGYTLLSVLDIQWVYLFSALLVTSGLSFYILVNKSSAK